jgi:hypothetical protein
MTISIPMNPGSYHQRVINQMYANAIEDVATIPAIHHPLLAYRLEAPLVTSSPYVEPFQQYRSKQLEQTPLLSAPVLFRARSTTPHARHAGHSGSIAALTFAGLPCVAIVKVWSRNACSCSVVTLFGATFVSGVSPPLGGPPLAR